MIIVTFKQPISSCFTIIIIGLRCIEVAAQFVSTQKWGPHGPQEAITSPSQHTASPAPSTCTIIISDHIVHVWGWLREAYLRNGEDNYLMYNRRGFYQPWSPYGPQVTG